MKEQLKRNLPLKFFVNQEQTHKEKLLLMQVPPANEVEVIAYLRRSAKFAEIAALAERDILILTMCEELGITASDEEWQATGDAFRREHQLFGTVETLIWLEQQRIQATEWSQGMRVVLLEKKLKEYLFGASVDRTYIAHNNNYRKVALSEILVFELATAQEIIMKLKQASTTFCALALEYSQHELSTKNGGFLGIHYLLELSPQIAENIVHAAAGEVIGPIQTQLGYHVIKIEKWFPAEFNHSTRVKIIDVLFQMWLKNWHNEFNS
ncbi:peptidylprolyl isomerase [Fortiea contorta]|uniref:peptidylprolyl isomerase n=1 Tax=Fortiea contorta TaxID=1892405 RepID=UPI00034660DA|nr:peptidylprolyl isomerase [Fortiea contorta]